jgi:hypothetical protein
MGSFLDFVVSGFCAVMEEAAKRNTSERRIVRSMTQGKEDEELFGSGQHRV